MRHLRLLGILGFLVSPPRLALAGEGGTPQVGWLASAYEALSNVPPLTPSLFTSALKSNSNENTGAENDRATAIRNGLSINAVLDCEDPDQIALIVAAREQKWNILRELLLDEDIRNNYDRNKVDAEHKSALVWALENACPHLDILGRLFTDASLSYQHPKTKERLLHIAVRGTTSDDNTTALQWLIRKHHPCYFVDPQDGEGKTPLMNVQCTEAVLLLRSVGADANATAKGLSVADWIKNSSTWAKARSNVPSVVKEYAPSMFRIKRGINIQREQALTQRMDTNAMIDDNYVTTEEFWPGDGIDESCYEIPDTISASPGTVVPLDEEGEEESLRSDYPLGRGEDDNEEAPRRVLEGDSSYYNDGSPIW